MVHCLETKVHGEVHVYGMILAVVKIDPQGWTLLRLGWTKKG